MNEQTFTIDRQLAFKDGIAPRFAEQVRGAKASDERVVDVELSQNVADKALAGQTVQGTFHIKDVKSVRLPEATPEFLSQFGVQTIGQLRELIEVVLQRRLMYQQRQSARAQVLEQFAAASTWELPEDLLLRQAHKAMQRRVMEMKADGISEEEIAKRQRLLQQDILKTTALALKEHFVLQKIAEVEKIDVSEDDLDEEVERLAAQNNMSARRFRAQLEREDMIEPLMIEMIERKSLDLILDSAEYEDVPLRQDEQAPEVSTIEAQAVPGEMQDPTANPPPADEAATPTTPAAPGDEAK
jgi:trigger factor